MPLSTLKVLELNRKYNLITNLSERELENSEGVGIDLRVGEVFEFDGTKSELNMNDGFLGIDERKTPEIKMIASYNKDGMGKAVCMKPEDYFLVKTIEKINVPAEKVEIEKDFECYLMPVVYPRRTLQGCGIQLLATKTDPGYSGELVFGLKNLGRKKFIFELGARIANIVFEPVIGEISRSYEGQWNEGRITTGGLEKQI